MDKQFNEGDLTRGNKEKLTQSRWYITGGTKKTFIFAESGAKVKQPMQESAIDYRRDPKK